MDRTWPMRRAVRRGRALYAGARGVDTIVSRARRQATDQDPPSAGAGLARTNAHAGRRRRPDSALRAGARDYTAENVARDNRSARVHGGRAAVGAAARGPALERSFHAPIHRSYRATDGNCTAAASRHLSTDRDARQRPSTPYDQAGTRTPWFLRRAAAEAVG